MERGDKTHKRRIQRPSKQGKAKKAQVGIYQLGPCKIELVLDPNLAGGNFSGTGGVGGLPVIVIGSQNSKWNEVIQVLIHEAFEWAISSIQGRFIQDWTTDISSDTYFFAMNHNQFSEACSRVGDLITECVPDLCDAYKELKKKK